VGAQAPVAPAPAGDVGDLRGPSPDSSGPGQGTEAGGAAPAMMQQRLMMMKMVPGTSVDVGSDSSPSSEGSEGSGSSRVSQRSMWSLYVERSLHEEWAREGPLRGRSGQPPPQDACCVPRELEMSSRLRRDRPWREAPRPGGG